jgi:putative hydrolase of the HAD superfamily
MKKIFIFDMGGVVASNTGTIPAISAALGISEDAFFRAAGSDPAATHTSPYHLGDIAALMTGALSPAGFWDKFGRASGITVKGDPWYDYFNPTRIDGTISVIEKLRQAGYRVVCGTNTLESHYRKHQERGDYSFFDAVYASHLIGVIKPRAEFWEKILHDEGTSPGEAFFTDDLEENIIAADRLGLKAHLFTDPEKLRTAIAEYL